MSQSYRANPLYAALFRVVGDICRQWDSTPMTVRQWTRFIRQPDGSVSFPIEIRPDPGPTLRGFMASALESPAFIEVVRVVREEKTLASSLLVDAAGKPVAKESHSSWLLNFWITPFLARYFERVGALRVDVAVFDKLSVQLTGEATSPRRRVNYVSPLINAKLGSNRLEVRPELILRKITAPEVESWINGTWMLDPPLTTMQMLLLDCVMEEVAERTVTDPPEAPPTAGGRLLTGIRLLTDGRVYAPFT